MKRNNKYYAVDQDLIRVRQANSKFVEILLSAKAHWALRQYNKIPELNCALEMTTLVHHKHLLRIPEHLIAVMRLTINETIKKIQNSTKKGRCKYGKVTKKNLLNCLSQLHG